MPVARTIRGILCGVILASLATAGPAVTHETRGVREAAGPAEVVLPPGETVQTADLVSESEGEAAPLPEPESPLPPGAETPCSPPKVEEVLVQERIGAGPVVRFYTRGSRVEESEAYRDELRSLPPGEEWPWYQERIRALGFEVRDFTWGASGRPRYALEKNGLRIVLELTCDSRGRILALDPGPNL